MRGNGETFGARWQYLMLKLFWNMRPSSCAWNSTWTSLWRYVGTIHYFKSWTSVYALNIVIIFMYIQPVWSIVKCRVALAWNTKEMGIILLHFYGPPTGAIYQRGKRLSSIICIQRIWNYCWRHLNHVRDARLGGERREHAILEQIAKMLALKHCSNRSGPNIIINRRAWRASHHFNGMTCAAIYQKHKNTIVARNRWERETSNNGNSFPVVEATR